MATEATAFDDPETYWDAIRDGVQSKYPQTFAEQMARFIEWGSAIEVRHLLTHTSGHLSSAAFQSAADEYAGGDYYQLTYPQFHRYMLQARVWVGEDSDTLACVDEDLLADDPIGDLPLSGGVDDPPPPVDDELGAPNRRARSNCHRCASSRGPGRATPTSGSPCWAGSSRISPGRRTRRSSARTCWSRSA